MSAKWGKDQSKPTQNLAQPAIWKSSSKPGTFGLYIPNEGSFRVSSLAQAKVTLDKAAVTSTEVNIEAVSAHRTQVNESDILSQNLKRLQGNLRPQANDPRYLVSNNEQQLNRFTNILANANTAIRADLNANRVMIAGENAAIATQYPLAHQVESHLKMMVDNRTPVLAVLASSKEIATPGNKMPDYFSQSGTYGNIRTQSTEAGQIDLGDGVGASIHDLEIRGYDKSITVKVVHVHNWPDKTAISADSTKRLAEELNKLNQQGVDKYTQLGSKAVNDPNKLLPVIHCRAGVGRTGQVIGAMAMQTHGRELSVEQMVTDMRTTRNGIMVQKDEQLDTLVELAEQQGRPLLN